MKIISSLLMVVVMFLFANAGTEKPRVAVLQLKSDGISKSESQTMTDRLRVELVKSNEFAIIERGEMDEILKEQGFQMSGCTGSECAVEAGKLLSANQICAGSIGRVGSLFTLSVRLIDVESGQIIKSVTEDCKCPIEDVLTKSMRIVVEKLTGKIINSDAKTKMVASPKGKGDLFLKSVPDGADIFVDGVKLSAKTPTAIQNIEEGEHLIKVIKGSSISQKYVIVKNGEITTEILKLESAFGGLKVYSIPDGAEIYIDNKLVGKTPFIVKELAAGSHKVVLKKSGFYNHTEIINIRPSLDFDKYVVINVNLIRELKDIDGNIYKIVKIGKQVWMAENLRETKYQNGDPIPMVKDNNDWCDMEKGAYCFYDKMKYGLLYNWYAVNDSRKIAPNGWHIPSDDEWKELERYLKDNDNKSQFGALPGGYRHYGLNTILYSGCYYSDTGNSGYWWSSTEQDNKTALYRSIKADDKNIYKDIFDKSSGLSIRCIKD